MSNRERADSRSGRGRHGSRRRRQNGQANAGPPSTPIRRGRHVANDRSRTNPQPQSGISDSDAHPLRFGLRQGVNNNMALDDEVGEQFDYDIQQPSTQQAINGYNHETSRNGNIDADDQSHQAEAEHHGSLRQYVAQQQIVHGYALESWMAQSLRDEPVLLVPELLDPGAWCQQLESSIVYDRGSSDIEVIRGGTSDERQD